MAETGEIVVRVTDLEEIGKVIKATIDLVECVSADLDRMPPGPQARLRPRVERVSELILALHG